jgi:hypothetical protein
LPARRARISFKTGNSWYSSSGTFSLSLRRPVLMFSSTVNVGNTIRPCGT